MPYEVKGNELVPVKDAPSDLFLRFEQADEDQIIATMQGAALEEYVYSFEQGGKKVTGLSWVGTREAARNRGGIHISQPIVTETEDTFQVMVSAHDRVQDVVVWGGASQAKRMSSGKADPFAFQKALSKAQRNAMMAVLPTTVITKMIAAYLGKGQNVRRIAPAPKPAAPARSEPAPAPSAPEPTPPEVVEGEVVEVAPEDGQVPDAVRQAGYDAVQNYVTMRKGLERASTVVELEQERKAISAFRQGSDLPAAVFQALAQVYSARKNELDGQASF